MALGILSYFAGGILWAFSLRYEYLGRAISLFTIINLIVVVIARMLIFKEDISLVNKLGISLGIVSIVLIEAKKYRVHMHSIFFHFFLHNHRNLQDCQLLWIPVPEGFH